MIRSSITNLIKSSIRSRSRSCCFIKRSLSDHHENKSTIIAFNISDTIQIDRISQIAEFKNYKITKLPEDLRDEAILLSVTDKNQPDYKLEDVFVFRKGTIVLWGVANDKQKQLLNGLSNLTVNPHPKELIQDEREYLKFEISKSSDRSRLHRETVQLGNYSDLPLRHLDQFAISHAIALSVKLAVWESNLDDYIKSINWVTDKMKNGEHLNLTRDEVFEKTGQLYHLKHRIISSDLLDLPDVYWDRYYQEVLYLAVVSFLNIKKRTAVMNEKLNNCCELMNLLATHMSDEHHVRLERMIILLILVEVGLELAKWL